MVKGLKELADRLGHSATLSREGKVAIWGHLAGKRNDDLVIRIGESEYLIKADSVEKFEHVGTDENGEEVFLLVNDNFEFRTTAKNVAMLAGTRPEVDSVPFALGRAEQAPAHEHTEEEFQRFDKDYNEWRKKVGLFEEFHGSRGDQCTLTNTKLVTSCGILDKGLCPDGSQGDGCENY